MWLVSGTKFGFLWNPNERYCFSRRRQTKRREKGSYQWCVKWFSLTKGIQSYPIVLCRYTKKRSMRWTMNMLSPIFPPNCPLSCYFLTKNAFYVFNANLSEAESLLVLILTLFACLVFCGYGIMGYSSCHMDHTEVKQEDPPRLGVKGFKSHNDIKHPGIML